MELLWLKMSHVILCTVGDIMTGLEEGLNALKSQTVEENGRKPEKIKSLLEQHSPASTKTVSQDGGVSLIACNYMSAVFSQRPICFDKDCLPQGRSEREHEDRMEGIREDSLVSDLLM